MEALLVSFTNGLKTSSLFEKEKERKTKSEEVEREEEIKVVIFGVGLKEEIRIKEK